jgi:cell division topological specificity factor
MLGFLKSLFQPQPSSETAKERLKVVLLSDHLSLAPEVVEALKADLLAVITKYVEIDERNAEVTFEQRESDVALSASVPILAVKTERTATYRAEVEAKKKLAQDELAQSPPTAHPVVETGTIGAAGSRRRRKRRNRRLAQLQVTSTSIVSSQAQTTAQAEPLQV